MTTITVKTNHPDQPLFEETLALFIPRWTKQAGNENCHYRYQERIKADIWIAFFLKRRFPHPYSALAISNKTGYSISTVRAVLDRLEDKGFVSHDLDIGLNSQTLKTYHWSGG
jgi:hypothetical protein